MPRRLRSVAEPSLFLVPSKLDLRSKALFSLAFDAREAAAFEAFFSLLNPKKKIQGDASATYLVDSQQSPDSDQTMEVAKRKHDREKFEVGRIATEVRP
ncbi:MAG: hypothetical protein Q9190_006895 [Brigantiaea leucoxantha]